jgi:hypothetical protein
MTSEAKWNGPWSMVANSRQYTTIYDCNDGTICRLDLEDWGVTEENQSELEKDQADFARLIVAAPDLAEAVRDILALPLASCDGYAEAVSDDCPFCRARAALSRAESTP